MAGARTDRRGALPFAAVVLDAAEVGGRLFDVRADADRVDADTGLRRLAAFTEALAFIGIATYFFLK